MTVRRHAQVRRDGIVPETADFAFLADLRYVGQEHTIAIPVRDPRLLAGNLLSVTPFPESTMINLCV